MGRVLDRKSKVRQSGAEVVPGHAKGVVEELDEDAKCGVGKHSRW